MRKFPKKNSEKGYSLIVKLLIVIIVLPALIIGIWYGSNQWLGNNSTGNPVENTPTPSPNSSPTPTPPVAPTAPSSPAPSNPNPTPTPPSGTITPTPPPTPTPPGSTPTPTPPSPTPTPTPPTPTPFPQTTVNFDFDTGSPVLNPGRPTPFDQTKNGVTASFSTPFVAYGFSIQNYDTTFYKLSQLTGNYLYDNNPSRDILEIRFSHPLTSITFTYATFQFHGGSATDLPSSMFLTAYMDTTATIVGSANGHGTWPTGNDAYPQGTLTFNSATPFNIVRIELPYQGPSTPTDYLVDNVIVTTA